MHSFCRIVPANTEENHRRNYGGKIRIDPKNFSNNYKNVFSSTINFSTPQVKMFNIIWRIYCVGLKNCYFHNETNEQWFKTTYCVHHFFFFLVMKNNQHINSFVCSSIFHFSSTFFRSWSSRDSLLPMTMAWSSMNRFLVLWRQNFVCTYSPTSAA